MRLVKGKGREYISRRMTVLTTFYFTYNITYMSTKEKKKLTIMLDEDVYRGLHKRIGQRRIGTFLSSIARPFVARNELEEGYKALASDTAQQQEAEEWLSGMDDPIESESEWRF